MDIIALLNDKSVKPKQIVEELSNKLLAGEITSDALIEIARASKDVAKGHCVEALEFATRANAQIATVQILDFAVEQLSAKAPRVKWESAKVIGNVAHLFAENLDQAIVGLLNNSEHSGTVVRWSAAFALGEILKLKTPHNATLIPAVEAIIGREEKNSIRKIYQAGLKKSK